MNGNLVNYYTKLVVECRNVSTLLLVDADLERVQYKLRGVEGQEEAQKTIRDLQMKISKRLAELFTAATEKTS